MRNENDTWGLAYMLAMKKLNASTLTAPNDEQKMKEIVEILFAVHSNFHMLEQSPMSQLFTEVRLRWNCYKAQLLQQPGIGSIRLAFNLLTTRPQPTSLAAERSSR
ncbi:hypothetical protein ACLKA7_001383 [Drosophila subpalustris]